MATRLAPPRAPRHGPEHPQPRREAPDVPEERGGVGAGAQEGAVAEGDQPEAPHERPRPTDERPAEDLHQTVERVLAHAAHGQEGGGGDEGEDGGGGESRHGHSRFARMPPGRANIITMNSTKAIT